jgi:hypothetical protein
MEVWQEIHIASCDKKALKLLFFLTSCFLNKKEIQTTLLIEVICIKSLNPHKSFE